jgi:hypothetical protein
VSVEVKLCFDFDSGKACKNKPNNISNGMKGNQRKNLTFFIDKNTLIDLRAFAMLKWFYILL